MTLGNPFGLLALTGIPAVLAIHFLQQRARPKIITTLFLVEEMPRPSTSGTRIERLRSSVPLWLQLVAVLALTWLFTDPRVPRANSVHRTVVVLDSSASMAAFKPAAVKSLAQTLDALGPAAATNEYTLLPTAPGAQRIYGGTSAAALLGSAEENWVPALGTHDPEPSLRLARSLAGSGGTVLYVTDHLSDTRLPAGVLRLATGTPTPNSGFTGLTVIPSADGLHWSALVRNYSSSPTSRRWWLSLPDGKVSPARTLDLPPGGSTTLRAPFPAGADQFTLHLENDAFTFDDTLPVIRPEPVPLVVQLSAGVPGELVSLFSAIPDVTISDAPGEADVMVTIASLSTSDSVPVGRAVVFSSTAGQRPLPFARSPVTPENHPLTSGLSFSGLLFQDVPNLASPSPDETLLWSGSRSLVFLRDNQLWFNFDPTRSNALKLPAFVLLIHRFLADARENKVAPVRVNTNTGDTLTFAAGPGPLTTSPEGITVPSTATLTAPAHPGFFEIHQDGVPLLKGAAGFADAREADLTGAASDWPAPDTAAKLRTVYDAAHPLTGGIPVVLLVLLLASWHCTSRNA